MYKNLTSCARCAARVKTIPHLHFRAPLRPHFHAAFHTPSHGVQRTPNAAQLLGVA
jgi:hypothetical protein